MSSFKVPAGAWAKTRQAPTAGIFDDPLPSGLNSAWLYWIIGLLDDGALMFAGDDVEQMRISTEFNRLIIYLVEG